MSGQAAEAAEFGLAMGSTLADLQAPMLAAIQDLEQGPTRTIGLRSSL